mgnify:CR=1 FL=1
MVFVAGCVDAVPDDSRPGATPTITIDGRDLDEVLVRAPDAPAAVDICALASELPGDNICSLMCDPDAMEAQMVADGTPAGTCYELRCVLPAITVNVGVCLPPAA